jgi:hypothetical protein
MNSGTAELRALHDELRSGRYEGDQYELLHRFGNEGFVEALPTVETFLAHPDPELRSIALNVLVFHWGVEGYAKTCLEMAECDPDPDVRRLAASCVGGQFRKTRHADALRVLLRLIADDEQRWDVRDSSYSAILEILGVPLTELPAASRKLNWPADIDWPKVREAQAIVGESYAS